LNVSAWGEEQIWKLRTLVLVVKELPEKLEAQELITQVENLIREKEEAGYNVTEAKRLLDLAREQFELENYLAAIEFAQQAIEAAEVAPPLPKPVLLLWLVLVVVVGIVTLILIFILRKRQGRNWIGRII
jgi:hypothetical protein